MLPSSRCMFLLVLVVSATLAGCNSSNVVPVSGTLTYKGKPVTNAFIHFVPESGRPSLGETDSQGRFTLTYDPDTRGATLGKHRVFVMHNPLADTTRPDAIPGVAPQLSPDMTDFFRKYSGEQSKVEVVIDAATSDLVLAWD